MSRIICFIAWLLIQAAIVESSLQMAADGSDIKWGPWSQCKIHDVCPHGRRERRRLCDENDLNCINIKLVQIGKCRVKNCKGESYFESFKNDFTEYENNGIKYRLKPFQNNKVSLPTALVNASNDHGTTGLTYLVCAMVPLIVLQAFNYFYIYRKGYCIKCNINEAVLPPPTIKTYVGPPPKEGLNSTARCGKSDSMCDKNFGSTPFSGTPARDSVNVKTPSKNAGRNDDNPQQESPNFGGDVKKEIEKDLSAKYTTLLTTEVIQNDSGNQIHPHTNSTQEDQDLLKKPDHHKGTIKPEGTVKSLEIQPRNNSRSVNIDNSLKQTNSSKSTRSLQTPTKPSRFSFFKRKNKSAESFDTDQARKKEKKSRSFFSLFKKNKPSKQESQDRTTVSRPENNYFVTFKKYTRDFRLDPSPCRDADQCVTEVASCHNLRSVSSERLKWESRTRTASLSDLGSDVIKESLRFL